MILVRYSSRSRRNRKQTRMQISSRMRYERKTCNWNYTSDAPKWYFDIFFFFDRNAAIRGGRFREESVYLRQRYRIPGASISEKEKTISLFRVTKCKDKKEKIEKIITENKKRGAKSVKLLETCKYCSLDRNRRDYRTFSEFFHPIFYFFLYQQLW